MKCSKEIVTAMLSVVEQDDDCDLCFVLGVDEYWLHRTPLHKFDQATRDCIPLRKTSIRMGIKGVFWRAVFSSVSNRWVFVNRDVREDTERFLQANFTK